MKSFLLLIIFISSTLFLAKRGLRYFQFFQQEGYKRDRFLTWYRKKLAFDKRGSLLLVLAIVIVYFSPYSWLDNFIIFMSSLGVLIIASVETDPRYAGKLPLNMTARAKRIYALYIALLLLSFLIFYSLNSLLSGGVFTFWIFQILFFQATPFLLTLSDLILQPYEERLQLGFKEDAKRILAAVDPFVIGITGSYGKTTTKHILGQLLAPAVGSTFWPEKGINTDMGIARSIRTNMKPDTRYAIIEMAAYHIGSIKRLCTFTPPSAGIITAVGIMHLDRFAGEDNIYTAKSELAQAVPEDGILVCNGDNPGARRMASEFKKKTTIIYGTDSSKGALDCLGHDIVTTKNGTEFFIDWKGRSYRVTMPMFGLPAVSNALAAFALTCELGCEPEYVAAAFASIEQVDNRLYVEKQQDCTYLRDAYNSNPIGFASALDVLSDYPAGRKILITPGMIELGEKQFDENKSIAVKAAKICSYIFIVGEENRDALLAGTEEAANKDCTTIVCENRDEAFARLMEIQAKDDVILIENDLPDLLEGQVRF